MFDPIEQHVVVKRFQYIIICTQTERILCDPFLPYSRNHDECRRFFEAFVMGKFLHYCQSVHFRHNDIQNNNIWFLFTNNITDFFSVMCFSNQFKVFIFLYDLTKYFHHSLIIIRNCHI